MEHEKGGAMLGVIYVKERKIGDLFQTLTASLVCHRPEDHISFLLQTLTEIRDEKEVFLRRLHAHVRATSPLLPPLERATTKSRTEKHARKGKLKKPKLQQTSKSPQNQEKKSNVTNFHPNPLPEISDLFGVSGDVANQMKTQPLINLLLPLQKSKHNKPPFRTGIVIDKDSRRLLEPASQLDNYTNAYIKAKPPLPRAKQLQMSKAQDGGKNTNGKGVTKGTESVYLTDGGQDFNRNAVGKKRKRKNKGHVQVAAFTDLHTWPTPQESLELLTKQHPICQRQDQQKPSRPKVKWRSVTQQFSIRFDRKISSKIDERYLQDFVQVVQKHRQPKRKRNKAGDRYLELEDFTILSYRRKVLWEWKKKKKQRTVEEDEIVDDTNFKNETNVGLHQLLARKKRVLEDTHYDNIPLVRLSLESNLKKRKGPQIRRRKAIRRRVAKRKAAGKERRKLPHSSDTKVPGIVGIRNVKKTPDVSRNFSRTFNHLKIHRWHLQFYHCQTARSKRERIQESFFQSPSK